MPDLHRPPFVIVSLQSPTPPPWAWHVRWRGAERVVRHPSHLLPEAVVREVLRDVDRLDPAPWPGVRGHRFAVTYRSS